MSNDFIVPPCKEHGNEFMVVKNLVGVGIVIKCLKCNREFEIKKKTGYKYAHD